MTATGWAGGHSFVVSAEWQRGGRLINVFSTFEHRAGRSVLSSSMSKPTKLFLTTFIHLFSQISLLHSSSTWYHCQRCNSGWEKGAMPLYVLTWQKLSCLDTSCSFHDMIPSSNWNGTSNVQLLYDVLVQQKPRGVSLDMALLLHERRRSTSCWAGSRRRWSSCMRRIAWLARDPGFQRKRPSSQCCRDIQASYLSKTNNKPCEKRNNWPLLVEIWAASKASFLSVVLWERFWDFNFVS